MSKRTIYKRKKNGKTDYKKRLKLLKSRKPRLVIRKSLTQITAQIIQYQDEGDKVLVSAHSSELKAIGWKMNPGNIPAAYLTGLLIGQKAKAKKIEEAVLDIGLNTPTKGSRIFAALKGAVDADLNVPHSDNIFPDEDAIKCVKISNYFKDCKDKLQFSQYKKDNVDPTKNFEAVKAKIMK
ncbi:MAG: 50S ribosomal protein L18 [Nanoarchaeota archaeon]|nr:50S ribosomal protein L18 [Nanoarchaeota archaeon]